MKTQKMRHLSAVWVVSAALVALTSDFAWATTATWTNTAAGSYLWTDTANWLGGVVPNAQDDVAYLTNNIAGNQTIDLKGAVTLGQLYIGDDNSTHAFVITNTAANTLTFQVTSGSAVLQKNGIGSASGPKDTMAANVTLASDISITNAAGGTWLNQPLTISGNIGESGGSRKTSFVTVSWEGFVLSGSNSYSGGAALSFGNQMAYVEMRNPYAFGTGAVTTTPSRVSAVWFNLSAPAAIANNMALVNGPVPAVLNNITTNEVTLNGNLTNIGDVISSGIKGAGSFVLGGNINTSPRLYIENTTVKIAATATFGASCSAILLAEGNSKTGKLYLANGATVTKEVGYANGNWAADILTVSTPVYLGMYETGSATVSGNVQLNGNNSSGNTAVSPFYLDTPSGATLTLGGIVKNSNTYATNTLVKIGAGTVVLANANTYMGTTVVSNGTLSVSNNAALGTGLLTMAGGTLAASAGSWTIANTVNLASNATINTGANTLTLSGSITNSGGLTKTGSGTLVFTGSVTYSGATLINGGTIKTSLGHSVPTGSTVTITNGATLDMDGNSQTLANLDGGGRVTNGTLTVTGSLAPAGTNVVGTQWAPNLAMAASSVLKVDCLNGATDLVEVSGVFTAGANVSVIVNRVGALPSRLTLIHAAGGITTPENLATWVITGAKPLSMITWDASAKEIVMLTPSGTIISAY